jgi:hypothetical protein
LFACAWIALFAAFPVTSLAQPDRAAIDKSKIPATAAKPSGFVPAGWKIEEQITGDLNGDSKPDYVLKLVEDKPKESKDGIQIERVRALVVVLQEADGKLRNVAVADRLLQCTGCGGALYGLVDAPASVKIEKGVIIVQQDHGSRTVSDMTFRFRLEPETSRFLLIGFDYHSGDRATGDAASESTNYITGARITTQSNGKGKKDTTTRSQVAKTKTYLDQIDYEKFEEEASGRVDG